MDAKPHLTPRLKEVVRLVSLGCTNEETGAILKISPATVDNHKTRAMAAFGTNKAVLMTRLALKYRITSQNDKLTTKEKRLSGRKGDGWN